MTTLNAVIQDTRETLREYVERFIRADVEVSGTHDGLKYFILESNLRDDYKFKQELGLRVVKDMNDLPKGAQPYINYEEKKLAEEALKSRQSYKAGNDGRRNDGEKTKGFRPHPRDYTPLNATRETILLECYTMEFRAAGIKAPQSLKESARSDKTKYCRYHQSRGHDTGGEVIFSKMFCIREIKVYILT
jgi:hypothetical protein